MMSDLEDNMAVRDMIDNRRALLARQAAHDDFKSALCDSNKAMRVEGLAAQIMELKNSPETKALYDYIFKLEHVRYSTWCAKCTVAMTTDRMPPAPADDLELLCVNDAQAPLPNIALFPTQPPPPTQQTQPPPPTASSILDDTTPAPAVQRKVKISDLTRDIAILKENMSELNMRFNKLSKHVFSDNDPRTYFDVDADTDSDSEKN